MLAVSHQRDKIAGFGESGNVVAAAPAVFHEATVCGWTCAVLGFVNDSHADLVPGFVQCLRRIGVPRRKPVAVGDVDVFDVELDSPVAVGFAERDHRFYGSIPRGAVSKELSQPGLLESFVREQRHDFHAVLLCQIRNSPVESAPHDSETVHHVDLRSENGNLVDVLDQAVVAVLAVHVVKEPLAGALAARLAGKSRDESKREEDTTDHENAGSQTPSTSFQITVVRPWASARGRDNGDREGDSKPVSTGPDEHSPGRRSRCEVDLSKSGAVCNCCRGADGPA